MCKSLVFPAVFLTAILVAASCGQNGGSNPIGVTSGGDSGHGIEGANQDNSNAYLLVGRWTPPIHWEETRYLTLNTDGTANYSRYYLNDLIESTDGFWSIIGINFEIDIAGFSPCTGWYRVGVDELYLYTFERYYYYVRARDMK